jgi:hypothetical protein
LDKSKACFRRLQNSPAAQTIVIADLQLRQALLAKTLPMTAQMNIIWATTRFDLTWCDVAAAAQRSAVRQVF